MTQDTLNLAGEWWWNDFDGQGVGIYFVRVSGRDGKTEGLGLGKDDFAWHETTQGPVWVKNGTVLMDERVVITYSEICLIYHVWNWML